MSTMKGSKESADRLSSRFHGDQVVGLTAREKFSRSRTVDVEARTQQHLDEDDGQIPAVSVRIIGEGLTHRLGGAPGTNCYQRLRVGKALRSAYQASGRPVSGGV